MKVLGLTGSIGMGKTTAAQMFAAKGASVWNADEAVHRLYDKGGSAVGPIAKIVPNAVNDGAIDRQVLKLELEADPSILPMLETIVHPLVQKDRSTFLSKTQSPLVVLDIPLLFETGANEQCDAAAVVSTDLQTQRARVLARDTMTETTFDGILARQMPDAEKRARADFIICSDTLETASRDVDAIWQRMVAEI